MHVCMYIHIVRSYVYGYIQIYLQAYIQLANFEMAKYYLLKVNRLVPHTAEVQELHKLDR